MLRPPITRLAVAVAATAAICAAGATAASAAPHADWGPARTVPGAITNSSPAISQITFPDPEGQGIIVGWRDRGPAGAILYKYKVAGLNKGDWSKEGIVPYTTSSAPAFASYQDPDGHGAVLAVWTGSADHHIWYAQGQTKPDGEIQWTRAADLPKTVADASTADSPAVLFTAHAYRVIVSWRGPDNHVRFTIGTPQGRGFTWSQSTVVPGPPVGSACATAPCTIDTPALAEVSTSSTDGTIYFLWRELGSTAVIYATTDDSAANLAKPVFTRPTDVPGAATLESPAASATHLNGFGPLLLAYKEPKTTSVQFQTLSAAWSKPATVPDTRTAVAPVLLLNAIATTTPAADGNIELRTYK